jgi:outer membrane autotransporter protein
LGELALEGMADLRGTDGNATFNRLQVQSLRGSGTFALGTDLTAGLGDFLDVTGVATGSHRLLIDNTGAEPVEGAADLRVVHTGGGDAAFSVIGDTVDAGAYTYQLEQRPDASGANDWFLVQMTQASCSASAAVGLFSAAPTVWYGETTTLRTRIGELRNGTGQGGVWLRSYGSRHIVSGGSEFAYSQNQRGISFGADAPLTAADGQWLVGVMGGYSQSNLDLGAGSSGKVDSFYVGAYSTWLTDSGYYVDALIKANRLQNRTNVVMRDGQKAKGRYTQHGIGGSVEVGKHIALDESTFVAPYAQVSALWITAGDYALDNGLDARGDMADSLVSKVGAQVGRRFALEHGGSVQPYVKVAVAHEFANSNKVKVNGHRFDNDLSGTRGELGVGVSAQMTDVLQVHADFDYMQGKHIEQPWGASIGVRYNF